MTSIDLDAIERAALAASPGPWEVDSIRNDGDYSDGGPDPCSGFNSYAVFAGKKTLLDTLNSDASEVHEEVGEEDIHAWDEIGRKNAEFIAEANPAIVLKLIGALKAINEIRNSIIGTGTVNWSEHIYPLVSALDAAGIEGMPYPDAKEHYGNMLERTVRAEKENAELRAKVEAYDKGLSREWSATNIKTGKQYTVTGDAINTTNAQDSQLMVIYERDGKKFVREACEFQEKFTT